MDLTCSFIYLFYIYHSIDAKKILFNILLQFIFLKSGDKNVVTTEINIFFARQESKICNAILRIESYSLPD